MIFSTMTNSNNVTMVDTNSSAKNELIVIIIAQYDKNCRLKNGNSDSRKYSIIPK